MRNLRSWRNQAEPRGRYAEGSAGCLAVASTGKSIGSPRAPGEASADTARSESPAPRVLIGIRGNGLCGRTKFRDSRNLPNAVPGSRRHPPNGESGLVARASSSVPLARSHGRRADDQNWRIAFQCWVWAISASASKFSGNVVYCLTSSTRRFFPRPSSVSFEAIGEDGPSPSARSRAARTPYFDASVCATALARRIERSIFASSVP